MIITDPLFIQGNLPPPDMIRNIVIKEEPRFLR